MILNIICIAIIILYGVVVVAQFMEDILAGIFAFIAGGVVALLLMGLAYGGLHLIQKGNADRVTEVVRSEQLSALNTSDKSSGRFFLGSGTIDSNPVVRFMTKDSEGGYQVETKNFNTSKVYEIPDGETPRMECSQEFLLPHWSLDEKNSVGESTCKFYVPKGSIIEDYELSVN